METPIKEFCIFISSRHKGSWLNPICITCRTVKLSQPKRKITDYRADAQPDERGAELL